MDQRACLLMRVNKRNCDVLVPEISHDAANFCPYICIDTRGAQEHTIDPSPVHVLVVRHIV
eukprot:1040230-Pyramimonas_sp.AAC.1